MANRFITLIFFDKVYLLLLTLYGIYCNPFSCSLHGTSAIVTYEEQTRGWLGYIAKANSLEDQIIAYRKLEKHIATFSRLQIIGFDNDSANIFKKLRANYPRLGTMDLKIAAIAISKEATLLTRNFSDFQNIVGLKFEDWTI